MNGATATVNRAAIPISAVRQLPLRGILDFKQQIERMLIEEITVRMPIGATVHVMLGERYYSARVLEHLCVGPGDVKVKLKSYTGAEYWIYATRLREFAQL